MRNRDCLVLSVLLLSAGTLCAEPYDYFRNAQLPTKRRPDVSLDRVEQEGGPDVVGHRKRVVHWWPKRGVDIVDVPEEAIYRTWTLRSGEEADPDWGAFHGRQPWPVGQPKTFKAHLLGFRGIGNLINQQFFGVTRGAIIPAVVLRLPDGSKRCFTRGSFIETDEDLIMDLYEKEMARIKKTLYKAYYNVSPWAAKMFPNIAEPGEPGTMRFETTRFSYGSGSQAPPGKSNPWVDMKQKEKTELFRQGTFRCAEDFWAYQEYAGTLMPYWDKEVLYKYRIGVCGTFRDGDQIIPGYAGGGYGACDVANAGGGPWSWGLFHEWGHGMYNGGILYPGGAETSSDACQMMADPSAVHKAHLPLIMPHKHILYGQYPAGLAYITIADDPNWGYAMPTTLLTRAALPGLPGKNFTSEETPLYVMARLGQERGIWKNGIKGVGDLIGQIYARLPEFDYELQHDLRKKYNHPRYHHLEAMDLKERLYRSPMNFAPEPFGGNMIRLMPDKGATKIAVDFRGIYDPDTYADWRACLVAVNRSGKCRYSPLFNMGTMEMPIEEGDVRFWLTVAGTPQALPDFSAAKRVNEEPVALYEAGFPYKYPYEVKLTDCRPGTRRSAPGDFQNLGMNYYYDWSFVVPHPSDSPTYVEMKTRLEALIKKTEDNESDFLAKLKAFTFDKENAGRDEHARSDLTWRRIVHLCQEQMKWLLANAEGKRHANGGGWVANNATVAPTAYVGPASMVLDHAQVLDQAIIEEGSIVFGKGTTVSGHARVNAGAIVAFGTSPTGYARVSRGDRGVEPPRVKPSADGKGYILVPRNEPKVTVVEGIEKRQLYDKEDQPLEANFAFDRPETVLLEDWFKARGGKERKDGIAPIGCGGPHWNHMIFHSGRLYGEPGFVVDGKRRAFTFNGENQYGEIGSAAVDLGEATIDMAIKCDGGAADVLFDFGTGKESCMVLLAAGGSGKPELVVRSRQDSFSIVASKPLPKSEWARLRVESDGTTTALYLDGKLVGSRKTAFRPAHLFPGGQARRNFIAARRDGTDSFKGSIDFVRVYHAVLKKFGDGPPVPRLSSRRISEDLVQGLVDYYDPEKLTEDSNKEGREALDADLTDLQNDEEEDDGFSLEEIDAKEKVAQEAATDLRRELCKAPREYSDMLPNILAIQQAKWHTTVNWDGRLPWEVSGKISPHLMQWLARIKPDQYQAPPLDPKYLKPDPKTQALVEKYDYRPPRLKAGTSLPSKATWAYDPVAISGTSIKMAGVLLDPSLKVEYRFEAIGGGHSSEWQREPVYVDEGLVANREYRYRLHMRQAGGATLPASAAKSCKTDMGTFIIASPLMPYLASGAGKYHFLQSTPHHTWKPLKGHAAPLKSNREWRTAGRRILDETPEGFLWTSPGDGATASLENAPYCLPRVDYLFRFDKPGKYYLYTMGNVQGVDYKKGNSVYVGLDLVPLGDISFSVGGGTPVNTLHRYWPSKHFVLDIKKSGVRRVSIWGREGGTIFGKVIITAKRDLKPSGKTIGEMHAMIGEGLPASPRFVNGEPETKLDFSVDEEEPEDDSSDDLNLDL